MDGKFGSGLGDVDNNLRRNRLWEYIGAKTDWF